MTAALRRQPELPLTKNRKRPTIGYTLALEVRVMELAQDNERLLTQIARLKQRLEQGRSNTQRKGRA